MLTDDRIGADDGIAVTTLLRPGKVAQNLYDLVVTPDDGGYSRAGIPIVGTASVEVSIDCTGADGNLILQS